MAILRSTVNAKAQRLGKKECSLGRAPFLLIQKGFLRFDSAENLRLLRARSTSGT
jgi:hypothetical protein